MGKILKIVLAALGTVVVVIIAAMIILPMVVDPNDYKDDMSRLFLKQTGRELAFGGDLSLSVFPWLGVSTGPVRVSDDAAYGDRAFAKVDAAEVKVKLIPLLSGEYDVENVTLHGLELNLTKSKKGVGNWEFSKPGEGKASSGSGPVKEADITEASPVASGSSGMGGLPVLMVGSVSVEKASVVYEDLATGQRYAVRDLNLETGGLRLDGGLTDISLSLILEASDPAIKAGVGLKAKAGFDRGKEVLAVRDLDMGVNAEGAMLPGGKAKLSLAGDADVDMANQAVALDKLKVGAYGLQLEGKARVANLDKTPSVDATLNMPTSDLRAVLDALAVPYEPEGDKALRAVSATIGVKGTAKAFETTALSLDLDGQKLTGSLKVADMVKPDVDFALKADALDVDPYMPKGTQAAPGVPPAPKKEGTDSATKEDPKKLLRTLVLDGSVDVGKLHVALVTLKDITIKARARNGVLTVDPLQAGIFGGTLRSTVGLDGTGKALASKVGMKIIDMDLGSFTKSLAGKEVVSGILKLDLDVSGKGDDWERHARALAGKLDFVARDGAFHGFQIVPEAAASHVKSGKQKDLLDKAEKQQKFEDMSGTYDIAGGIMKSRDISLDAGPLQAKGTSSVDIPEGTVELKANIDVPGLPTVPVKASGPYADISYGLDSEQFMKNLVTGIIDAPASVGKGVLDAGEGGVNLGKDALEGIGSGIQNLFGGGKKK